MALCTNYTTLHLIHMHVQRWLRMASRSQSVTQRHGRIMLRPEPPPTQGQRASQVGNALPVLS